MASLVADGLDDEKRAQLKAWFASARRRRPVEEDEILFGVSVEEIFAEKAGSQGSLGVDFVVAKEPFTQVDTGIRRLRLAQCMDTENGLGGVVWHCGRATCKLMSRLPELRKKKFEPATRILDLGCGTGLVGMTAFLYGAEVTLTDYLPSLVDLAKRNIQANFFSESNEFDPRGISVQLLQWGDVHHGMKTPFDIIFASDCLYDHKALPSLLTTLLMVTDSNSVVYLTYKRRIDDREQPFFIQLQSYFSDVAFAPPDTVQAEWRGSGLFLCRLTGKKQDTSMLAGC